eukprot:1159385-Pelagomonas_calceolata.AAC.4
MFAISTDRANVTISWIYYMKQENLPGVNSLFCGLSLTAAGFINSGTWEPICGVGYMELLRQANPKAKGCNEEEGAQVHWQDEKYVIQLAVKIYHSPSMAEKKPLLGELLNHQQDGVAASAQDTR